MTALFLCSGWAYPAPHASPIPAKKHQQKPRETSQNKPILLTLTCTWTHTRLGVFPCFWWDFKEQIRWESTGEELYGKIRQGVLTHRIPITTKDVPTQSVCPGTPALLLLGTSSGLTLLLGVFKSSEPYSVTEGLNPPLLSASSYCEDILTIPF